MGKKIRWGVLGYAGIARDHMIPAMLKAEHAEAAAIASRSAEKLEKAAADFGFSKVYESYDKLLEDPEIDAVYIPLPNALHKEWTIKAARSGKHVLCEKPLALTEKDIKEMEDVCNACHVQLMEGFMYRFTDRMRKLEQLLEQGVIGEVRHIYSTHRFLLGDMGDVRVDEGLGGGSLWDVGCYPVNLIGWILKEEPILYSVEKEMFQGVDFALLACLCYQNGVTASISCGFDGCSAMLTEINGTKGSILMVDSFIDSDTPIIVIGKDKKVIQYPVEAGNCYLLEIEGFSLALLERRKPVLSLEESLRNNGLIEKLLKA